MVLFAYYGARWDWWTLVVFDFHPQLTSKNYGLKPSVSFGRTGIPSFQSAPLRLRISCAVWFSLQHFIAFSCPCGIRKLKILDLRGPWLVNRMLFYWDLRFVLRCPCWMHDIQTWVQHLDKYHNLTLIRAPQQPKLYNNQYPSAAASNSNLNECIFWYAWAGKTRDSWEGWWYCQEAAGIDRGATSLRWNEVFRTWCWFFGHSKLFICFSSIFCLVHSQVPFESRGEPSVSNSSLCTLGHECGAAHIFVYS